MRKLINSPMKSLPVVLQAVRKLINDLKKAYPRIQRLILDSQDKILPRILFAKNELYFQKNHHWYNFFADE